MSNSLQPHGLYRWNSPGQNTGVGSLSLLHGIFTTQELNPGLPHCRWILYQLSHKGSPKILEWVAGPFSSGSSWPRNQTSVSCIAGRFFTNWAIREALENDDRKKLQKRIFFYENSFYGSFYGWVIPGTEEPGGLPSVGSHRVGHEWSDLAVAAAIFHCIILICTTASLAIHLLMDI